MRQLTRLSLGIVVCGLLLALVPIWVSGNTKQESFSTFTAKLEVEADELEIKGTFTLGPGSNGINLFKEDVAIRVGNFSGVVRAGSFKQRKNKQGKSGKLGFRGPSNGTELKVTMQILGKNSFEFEIELHGTNLPKSLKPQDITITIGDDSGSPKTFSK